MTDNEIIKALEHCTNIDGCGTDCPCFSENEDTCGDYNGFLKQCLDLINRQKAEIERLKSTGAALYVRDVAVEEFVKRFKEVANTTTNLVTDGVAFYTITPQRIDSLLKEMEGR